MLFLVENNTVQQYSDRDFVPVTRKKSHDHIWKILCVVTSNKNGKYIEVKQMLNSVKLDQLAFGWQKY
ncbi:hypothetical protein ACF3NR_09460 [Vaginella massiliensis]|uniref:hypothetical protein n=1 Tax=Vaginella massiliensis TaxID=1816680 RepID=UPI003752602D